MSLAASIRRPNLRRRSRRTSAGWTMPAAGLTLLEMILTMALLIMVGALALPAFRGSFDNQRLRKGGEQLRVEFARARMQAMKSGRILMLRYEIGGNQCILEPFFSEQDYVEGNLTSSDLTAAQAGSSSRSNTMAIPPSRLTLPERVRFAGGRTNMDLRDAQIQQQVSGSPLNTAEQPPPVIFYPDGTTSSAEVVLGNEVGFYVVVRLRSLTGMSKVSDLLNAQQIQQLNQ